MQALSCIYKYIIIVRRLKLLMGKQLTFNYITDLFGEKKRYPKSADYVSLFTTADGYYLLYASCTKRDLSRPDLVVVSEDTYNEVKAFFNEQEDTPVTEILAQDISEIFALIHTIQDAAKYEVQTIASMLDLKAEEDDGY